MPIIAQSDLENLLQIDVGAEPDPTVTWYIAAAQGAAEAYCQRHFDYDASLVETFDGGESTIIQVDRWPIDTVTSVVESGVTLTADTDYLTYTATGSIRRTSGGRIARGWRNDLQGVVISYAGGYVLPAGGSGATVPDDLTLVLTRMAGRLFTAGTFDLAGAAAAVSLDGIGSVTYRSPVFGGLPIGPSASDTPSLLDEEKAALGPYMNPGLV